MKKVLLISHFNHSDKDPIHGPIHNVASYFKNRKTKHKLIELPLYAGVKSFEETFDGKKIKRRSFGSTYKLPLPIKSLIETIQTVRSVGKEKYDLAIAADPLNAFTAILLKKLRKVKKVVYFTVDYAEERFPNKFLNFIYHFLDKFCLKFSDQIWNVSLRIYKRRQEQGVAAHKNYYTPNSPRFDKSKIRNVNNVNRNEVVMVSGITHTPVFDIVLRTMKSLSYKNPKIKMSVIGSGPFEDEFRKKVKKLGLVNTIFLLGQMNHADLMKKVSTCGVGLAIYTRDFSWTFFGDSMKAREYLACGVPVIISDVVSTAEDIEKHNAGIVIKSMYVDLLKALSQIIENRSLWIEKRENAIKLAKQSDFKKILDRILLS